MSDVERIEAAGQCAHMRVKPYPQKRDNDPGVIFGVRWRCDACDLEFVPHSWFRESEEARGDLCWEIADLRAALTAKLEEK